VADLSEGHTHRAYDREAAELVVAREPRVNAYDTEIEAESFRLLARRSPVAGDLRVILAVTRAVTDLERDREFEAALRRLMTVAMEQPQLIRRRPGDR